MEALPKKLVDFLTDTSKLKIGVGITQDMQKIMQDFKDLESVVGVVDLSDTTKKILVDKMPILSCGTGAATYSLRDLAAIILNVFVDNKGLSDVKKSNWDDINLYYEQIEYALTDSYLAIEMYNKLSDSDPDLFNTVHL